LPGFRFNVAVFWLVQASALLGFAVPPNAGLIALAGASHVLRMLGITAGFHRLLAHRAFETSRPIQFLLALLGTMSLQKGPIWWAGTHFEHHRNPDREGDPHSPARVGFYQAHLGWFLDSARWDVVDASNPVARRLSRYPELVMLDRPRAGVGVLRSHRDPRAFHLRDQHHRPSLRNPALRNAR
jgi:stearoyl-CoA desaturase (delta-9 desaturase)